MRPGVFIMHEYEMRLFKSFVGIPGMASLMEHAEVCMTNKKYSYNGSWFNELTKVTDENIVSATIFFQALPAALSDEASVKPKDNYEYHCRWRGRRSMGTIVGDDPS